MKIIIRIIKIITIVVGLIVGAYVVWMLTLPSGYTVVRSLTIQAPLSTVYATFNNLEHFSEWNPWTEDDPSSTIAVSSPAKGENASVQWKGTLIGDAKMIIKNTTPNQRIEYTIEYINPNPRTSNLTVELKSTAENATEVTWNSTGSFGFFSRFLHEYVDIWIGAEYVRGLDRLTMLLDSNAEHYTISSSKIETIERMQYIAKRNELSLAEIPQGMADNLKVLTQSLSDNNLEAKKNMSFYYDMKTSEQSVVVDFAVSFDSEEKLKLGDGVKQSLHNEGEYLVTTMIGNYQYMDRVWSKSMRRSTLNRYAIDKKRPMLEIYEYHDEQGDQNLTKVCIPIKKS